MQIKKYYLQLILFLIPLALLSQQNQKVYYDGQIWVQIIDPGQKIPYHQEIVDKVAFGNWLGEKYMNQFGVFRIEKPFTQAKDPIIAEVYEIHFTNTTAVEQFIRVLAARPEVGYAERIPIMRTSLTPNDNLYSSQYALTLTDANLAWNINTGDSNITIAVVDNAMLITHPDLQPNVWSNPGETPNNSTDDDGNGYVDDVNGFDVASNDNIVLPTSTGMLHGTHVSGTAAAATNNSIGVASISYSVSLIPVKASTQNTVITDGYAGIIYAYTVGADVINMSWGGSGSSQSAQNIINAAYNAGSILIAAAGNNNVQTQHYPAAYNNVIAVASTNSSDQKSGFSNYGTWIDISAPGSSILSTYFTGSYNPSYANNSGTSMASPMVASLCGLIKSVYPSITQAQLINCLLNNADSINVQNPSYIGLLGSGRINCYQSVLCAQQLNNQPPVSVISSDNDSICPGSSVQFFGSSSGGFASSYSWIFTGGTPSTSSQQNPTVTYANTGQYNVTLITSNTNGSDTLTLTNYITVSTSATQILHYEDFEGSAPGYSVFNPDTGITWGLFNVSGPNNGSGAAGISLYNYNATSQTDGLQTPMFDFSTSNNTALSLEYAYSGYSSSFIDTLQIYISTDGGSNYTTSLYLGAEVDTGSNFATTTYQTNSFSPNSTGEWCYGNTTPATCISINLSAYDGQDSIRLLFLARNDYGNNLFIDNVQITAQCAGPVPVAGFSSSNTTICQGGQVTFTDTSQNAPQSYSWTFQGGTPATSNQQNPTVTYNQSGTFNVKLIVTNTFGQDSVVYSNYVTVNPTVVPNATITSSAGNTICSNANVTFTANISGGGSNPAYQWLLNGNPVGSNQNTYTNSTLQNGDQIAVILTSNANCAQPTTDTSNIITMTVTGTVVPSATISANPGNTICAGTVVVTFTANISGGGNSPIYQWLLNGNPVGSNQNTYTNNALQNGDVISFVLTSSAACASPISDTSNSITMTVTPQPIIGVGGSPLTICAGDSSVLSATGASSYSWSPTATLNASTGIQVIATPNTTTTYTVIGQTGNCSDTATITITVNPSPSATVVNNNGVLSAFPVGLQYQWYLNSSPIAGATNQTYTPTVSGNYSVEVTNGFNCSAISASISVNVSTATLKSNNGYGIKIYPVPAKEVLNILLTGNIVITQTIVYDELGRMVISKNNSWQTKGQISVGYLAPGIYMLKLEHENGFLIEKFTVQ